MEALGVMPDETIAFEDSANGVRAAKAAGIFCVAIPNEVTRHMDFQHADHRFDSLTEFDIRQMLTTIR